MRQRRIVVDKINRGSCFNFSHNLFEYPSIFLKIIKENKCKSSERRDLTDLLGKPLLSRINLIDNDSARPSFIKNMKRKAENIIVIKFSLSFSYTKDITGWGENDRGVSWTFGGDIVNSFLNMNEFSLVARAHQVGLHTLPFFRIQKIFG